MVADALRAPTKDLFPCFSRLSLPKAENSAVGMPPTPVPGFGRQLNNRAIVNADPEGKVKIDYTEQTLTTADGTRGTSPPSELYVYGYLSAPTRKHRSIATRRTRCLWTRSAGSNS